MSAATRERGLFGIGRIESQQLGERQGSALVQTGTPSHLHCFQIQPPGLASTGERHLLQVVYFPANLALDCFRRFFPCAVRFGSWVETERRRQMAALTSTSA